MQAALARFCVPLRQCDKLQFRCDFLLFIALFLCFTMAFIIALPLFFFPVLLPAFVSHNRAPLKLMISEHVQSIVRWFTSSPQSFFVFERAVVDFDMTWPAAASLMLVN